EVFEPSTPRTSPAKRGRGTAKRWRGQWDCTDHPDALQLPQAFGGVQMKRIVGAVVMAASVAGAAQAQPISPYASAGEQQAAMADRRVTSEQLVRAYLDRIARYDSAGPKLNSVLVLNKQALADAKRLDAERKAGKVRGPLHGVPILLKDNVE